MPRHLLSAHIKQMLTHKFDVILLRLQHLHSTGSTAKSRGRKDLPSPEQKVDGVWGKESTPAHSRKAAPSRPGFQEREEETQEASVLGTFHLNPGRERGAGEW